MVAQITLNDLADKIELLVASIITNKSVLNTSEAAIYTGLTESYIYKLTSKQDIPHFKPRGKMIYFNRVELDDWLQQNRIKSNSEIEQAAISHVNGEAA
mgnify:CR=1 FL=1